MDKYILERDGQLDFYNRILPRVNPELTADDLLADSNDGVLNGNLIEFKLRVSDLNTVLFQCVKYLSALRIKGKPVPANIIIVDLNTATAWHYKSEPYLAYIEKPYMGGASKDNSGFVGGTALKKLRFEDNPLDTEALVTLLKENAFTKINIDENCVVGWATSFYKSMPNARKEDFLGDDTGKHKTIGEIRKPRVFAEYIHPYTGATNIRFNYLMDKLNDFLLKKNLGAFYTPYEYVEKAIELVRLAIARVPQGNDYIILDRCAGTGNLESAMTDDELSHCIVSTVEYYEYKVLQELLGSKVRHIIPPIETADTFNAGLVTGADALSKEYINNTMVKQYIDNPNCTVIIFENPPYADTTSVEHQRRGVGKASTVWKKSYAVDEMRKNVKGTALNDLGNIFIWTGFRYYLRQPTDSYIVFSPVKYWKAQHLVKKQFVQGFAFNRRHFHTNIDACIMCALWANVDDEQTTELTLTGYDIVNSVLTEHKTPLPIKRIFTKYSSVYFDKRIFPDDKTDGILCDANGLERIKNKTIRCSPIYNENCIGYLVVYTSGFDNPDLHSYLMVGGKYDGNGCFLRKDNYLEKLPMFAASRYITYNRVWTERARIMKSADGAERFNRDVTNGKLSQFLLKCLLFTCLEMQNHMRTLTGSDGRFYRNELCFDKTNGETIALHDIKGLIENTDEKALLTQWETVFDWAKKTENYNPNLTYGVYQIYAELDTSHKDEDTGDTVWDNVELHSALAALKGLVSAYYNAEIVPVLFEYEFVK
jgi:hypothetical protein